MVIFVFPIILPDLFIPSWIMVSTFVSGPTVLDALADVEVWLMVCVGAVVLCPPLAFKMLLIPLLSEK